MTQITIPMCILLDGVHRPFCEQVLTLKNTTTLETKIYLNRGIAKTERKEEKKFLGDDMGLFRGDLSNLVALEFKTSFELVQRHFCIASSSG